MTREEAIKILQGAIKKPNTKDGYLGQAIDMAIKGLESSTWIPVTERLPEESNEYLVSTVWEDVTTDYFRTDSGWMTFEKKEILAWMPLPQPYRGESEG